MSDMRPAPARAGFTLIELLVMVAVVAILIAAAVPSFVDALTRNRIVAQNNEIIAAFSFARAEALRRNLTVGVCALNAAGTGCATDTWGRGWLIWSDENRSGDFNAGDETLRVGRLDSSDSFNSTAAAAFYTVTFGPRGTRTLPVGATTFALQPDSCSATKTNRREFTISATGSIRSDQEHCE